MHEDLHTFGTFDDGRALIERILLPDGIGTVSSWPNWLATLSDFRTSVAGMPQEMGRAIAACC